MSKINVFLLSGKIGSGKSTVASIMETELKKRNYNVIQDSFAAPLKNMCKAAFSPLTEQINSVVRGMDHLKEFITEDINWFDPKNIITRSILQAVGTEIVRKINENYWVDSLVDRIRKNHFFNNTKNNVFVIHDLRFNNELFLDEKLQRVLMFEEIKVFKVRIEDNKSRATIEDNHVSENELNDFTFWDEVINNDGTIENLKDKILRFLSRERMII